jgi:hypothetical protein
VSFQHLLEAKNIGLRGVQGTFSSIAIEFALISFAGSLSSREMKIVGYFLLAPLCGGPAFAQTATLRGTIPDESGALVPGATVTLTGPSGQPRETTAANDGPYSFTEVPFGDYTAKASAPQLVLPEAVEVNLNSAVRILNLRLKVESTRQQVTVEDNAGPAVTTESAGNASALSVQGRDLQSLGNHPEDLATDLQALAGPSAGPSGWVILRRRIQWRADSLKRIHR